MEFYDNAIDFIESRHLMTEDEILLSSKGHNGR
jgi:hypothetical protein